MINSDQHKEKDMAQRPSLRDEFITHNAHLSTFCRRHGMSLKQVKLLKNALLSGVVILFGWVVVGQGADPTLVAGMVLTLVALLNGIELSEWIAVYGEVQKARAGIEDGGEDGEE